MQAIPKKVVYDEDGNPVEVILPWKVFREIEEAMGLDIDEEIEKALQEARSDREAGRKENYIPLEEV